MDKKIEKFSLQESHDISYSDHTVEPKKIDVNDFDNMSLKDLRLLRSSLDVVIRRKQKEESQDLGEYSNYFEKIVNDDNDYSVDESERKTKISSR